MNGSLIWTIHVIANRTDNFLPRAAKRKRNCLGMKTNRNRRSDGNCVPILCSSRSDRTCFYVCADNSFYSVDRIHEFGLERIWSDRFAQQLRSRDAVKAVAQRITNPKSTSDTRVLRNGYFEAVRAQFCDLPSRRSAQLDSPHIHVCAISGMEIRRDTKSVARHKRQRCSD